MEIILGLLAIALVIGLFSEVARDDRKRWSADFEKRTFSTSGGLLRGSDLRVVRYIHERSGGGSRFDGSAPGIHSGWWYCVGPGPRWFLVLAQEDLAWTGSVERKWVTKELTEREMRNALMGDAPAIAAAFGPPPGEG